MLELFKKLWDTMGSWYGPNTSRRYQEEVARIYRRNIQKDLKDQITTMMWSLTSSQTSCTAKSGGHWEASLWTNSVEVMDSSWVISNPKRWSKFSKPGFSNMWTVNLQMFKLVLEQTYGGYSSPPTACEAVFGGLVSQLSQTVCWENLTIYQGIHIKFFSTR